LRVPAGVVHVDDAEAVYPLAAGENLGLTSVGVLVSMVRRNGLSGRFGHKWKGGGMDSLDVLEPRVAGEEILEPGQEFTVQWQAPRLRAAGRDGARTYTCECVVDTRILVTNTCD
jgi:hypothetical protein